ncbi:GyrI-like domain-containing protein [Muricauda sp. 2012CJ35-5]|uniref:GyrI-like domain-containing protein n=1 Tax=Flagellimonas spongiicola TaxID=2942208 RepID=A0ABT0PTT6_9FLAO|nr:GyrI-like domain-containing protein [Allomuricauda spongiicola]MCL6274765.1 GyrI-like domain-containing protein [Allomuricauda spongiicola]
MEPRIETLAPKKLVGLHLSMNLVQNKTGQLWRQFAPRIKEIGNRVTADKISMQIYPTDYYSAFSPARQFEKWATLEVSEFENIPKGMESFDLIGGLYAVFDYKGSSADTTIYQYIFSEWIPNSAFVVDDRPHFEVLGKNYKNNDPNSEEEIWIPIKEHN